MRTMKAILLVAVLAVTATAAHAGTMTFGLNGDAAIPMGNLSKVPTASSTELELGQKVGFGGGVYGDYWIKDDYAFGVDINGDFFKAKDDFFSASVKATYPDISLKTTLISVGAHGVWAPAMKGSSFMPWVTYGAGLYHFSFKGEKGPAAFNATQTSNKFGLNIGVGTDMKAGASMKWGAQVKYHYVLSALDPKDFGGTGDAKAASYLTAGLHLTFMTSGATK